MALQAAATGLLYQQQDYPAFTLDHHQPSIFSSASNYDHSCFLPPINLSDFDLLHDCCYGLINTTDHHNNSDSVWDNCYYSSSTLSPPENHQLVGANENNNDVLVKLSSSTEHSANDNSYNHQVWGAGTNSSSPEAGEYYAPVVVNRPKRRRARARKNKEDIENQRMTHIAVERNRRRQMNDYLAVLRSLMPDSYVQRGDQASIVGGAINFVKELEQNLQCLSAKKHTQANLKSGGRGGGGGGFTASIPFGEFFTFPQYSCGGGAGGAATSEKSGGDDSSHDMKAAENQHGGGGDGGATAADVEVTMVESHALVKIRSRRPPKHLSKIVVGLQSLSLIILHLNLTKVDGVALYSFSVKVEDESKLSSVDEIAGAVYELLGRIQEEDDCNP